MRHLDLLGTKEASDEEREAARELSEKGENALDDGFSQMAELRFKEAFELDRSDPRHELNFGRAILANPKRNLAMRLRMARVHLELAAKRLPEDPTALYYLGACQYEAGDAVNARRNLQKALELQDGVFPEAQLLLERLGEGRKKLATGPKKRLRLFKKRP